MILTEIQIFVMASVLLIVQFLVAAFMKTLHPSVGLSWGLSPRDEEKETPLLAKRAGRAAQNFLETFPVFVGLIVFILVIGKTGSLSQTGAMIYLISRVVYFVIYVTGIPFALRTITWMISLLGLGMMARALFL